jgi:hypothetical protein
MGGSSSSESEALAWELIHGVTFSVLLGRCAQRAGRLNNVVVVPPTIDGIASSAPEQLDAVEGLKCAERCSAVWQSFSSLGGVTMIRSRSIDWVPPGRHRATGEMGTLGRPSHARGAHHRPTAVSAPMSCATSCPVAASSSCSTHAESADGQACLQLAGQDSSTLLESAWHRRVHPFSSGFGTVHIQRSTGSLVKRSV